MATSRFASSLRTILAEEGLTASGEAAVNVIGKQAAAYRVGDVLKFPRYTETMLVSAVNRDSLYLDEVDDPDTGWVYHIPEKTLVNGAYEGDIPNATADGMAFRGVPHKVR